MKLQHEYHCVLKDITKKPIYFLFDRIYLLESNITLQKKKLSKLPKTRKWSSNSCIYDYHGSNSSCNLVPTESRV